MDAVAGPQEPGASARISSSSAGSTLFFSSRDLAGAQPAYGDDDVESWFDLQVDAALSSKAMSDQADVSAAAFQFPLPAAHSSAVSPPPSVADELFRGGRIVPLGELLLAADEEKKPGEGRGKTAAGIGSEGRERQMAPLDIRPRNQSEGVRRPVGPVESSDVGRTGAPRGNDAAEVSARSGRRRRSTGTHQAMTETPTTQPSSRVWSSHKPPKPRRGSGSSSSSLSFLKLLIKLPSNSIRSAYLFFVRPAVDSPASSTSPSRPQKPKKPSPFQGMLVPIHRLLTPNGHKAHKERERVVFELGGGSAGDVLEAMRLSNASSSGRWRDARSPARAGSRPSSRPGSPLSSPKHKGARGAANRDREAERERRRAFERDSSISSAIAYCKGAHR